MNDALALETARKIEAIFAREHKGGEVQRRAAIQCAVLDAIAAAVPLVGVEQTDDPYLVWSNEHRAWWRPNRMGYTVHFEAAGRYSREQAIEESRIRDQRPGEIMPEIPVREADVLAARVPAPPRLIVADKGTTTGEWALNASRKYANDLREGTLAEPISSEQRQGD